MLKRLSKHQQEIAIYFITLFIIGGIIPMKVSAYNDTKSYSYSSGSGYRSSNKVNPKKPLAPQGYVAPINKASKAIGKNSWPKNFPVKNKINTTGFSKVKNVNNKPFIGGPGQPEMGAFKPVGADNMVDLFSGDMSYNIPLLDVGGYPVNIFYNSGITMDQEASWAGLGWNINPGTIMRNMRGVPDDFNGTDMVTKTLSMRADKTWGMGVGAGVELVGFPAGFGANFGINFNNQRGVGTDFGVNAKVKLSAKMGDDKTGTLSIGAGINLSSQGGATFTPSIGLSLKGKDAVDGTSTSGSLGASVGYNSRVGLQSLHIDAEVSKSKTDKKNLVEDASGIHGTNRSLGSLSVLSSNISFAYPSVTPSIRARMSRLNISASLQFGTELFYIHPHASINGYYTVSRIAEEDKVTQNPAYGVMFYQNGNEDPNALLDFNRLQDGVFTKNNPTIAIPTYSYDVFSISGEGVGGSFRAYRGDLGYVHDAKVATRDDAGKVGFDIGLGPLAGKVGVNLEYVYSPTVAGSWEQGNLAKNMLTFKKSKAAYQSLYFKNPGEKTIPDIEFQKAVGGENLVRLKMAGYGTGSTTLLSTLEQFDKSKYKLKEEIPLESKNVIKNRRDKRTQIITCLNAEEASRVGFDSTINSYDPTIVGAPPVIFGNCGTGIKKINRNSQAPHYTGTDAYRKAHHISEINVLGGDGRKYVYGIPVYNTKQIDATFNIGNGSTTTMQSSYNAGVDDGLGNTYHKDWYIEKEEMPAYTHSFLLTELVSPNYVDLTNNGISEDDMGDAVKFNYNQLAPIKWRTPTLNAQNIASYSQGLKTYNQDDKAHYTYGEREQWYLYSVESKNMVARFYVENDRRDGKQVLGIGGGLDASYGAQRLSKISLFSKGDLVKLGANAKPIKTVHLEYDYSLCPNTPTNSGIAQNVTINNATVNLNANKGKLTLRSIYFTYNGNERSKKNKYTFHYPADKNPSYQYTSNDRWGNYKPAVADPIDGGLPNNLGGLSNADFSYSIQDKTKADKYAGAWVMDSIGLPSGGKIKVNYETDDYAYVQDRRAASMFQIAGFGGTNTPTDAQFTTNRLYDIFQLPGGLTTSVEYEYIYAQIPTAISTTQSSTSQLNELQSKYFSNYPNVSKQIMLKLTLPVGSEEGGYIGGNEMVAMYVDVESFGLLAPASGQTTSNRIFIKVKMLEKHTPMVQYALQFAKNSLPGVAFPGSVNDGGIVGTVKALAAMIGSFKELLNGVDNVLKGRGLCQTVVMDKSFVRLSNPYFTKYGGGLRVKKVTISDNWDKMTGQPKSTYGQEYKYTKQELINGKLETISSGVASWEPAIGGEENPHREMMTYYNHNKGGPFDYNSVELPLAEMFFPSANVGYSHVEVLPLHRDTVKNAVGKSTTDFFTTRDFPTKSDNTFLEDIYDGGANFYESPKVLQNLNISNTKSFALSQGFKVDLNDMNGKVQRQESLGANGARISFTENYYNTTKATDQTFKFNHYFPTVSSPNGKIEKSLLGRDIEVMTDLRNHNSQTISANININIDVQVFGIFPVVLPPIFSPVFFEENDYKSAAMLKVINHFGMLDSTVVIDKGSQVSTKNLLYDAETGNVLLTRTNNEYDKPIYNFTYPAHWAYSGMGPAYQNIDVIYDNLTFRNGIIENPVQQGQTIDFKNFESGDELYVYSPLINGPLLTSCDQGLCALPKNQANRIWAINTNKTGGPDRFTFMDAQGNPYNAMQVNMRIIRSGHRNMLEQMVGGITSLQSPITKSIDGTEKLEFNDTKGIIQTSAATFKDNWRVDDANYRKDSILRKKPTYRAPNFTVCRGDTNGVYSSCGSFIYASYNASGSHFVRSRINIVNPFWIGNPADQTLFCNYNPDTTARQNIQTNYLDTVSFGKNDSGRDALPLKGPLNRCGIWACPNDSSSNNRWIGFSRVVNTASTKVYYIGMAADNKYRFRVDGQTLIETIGNNQEDFKAWHIYPVSLSSGSHIIEMEGYNFSSIRTMGAEIYDNTKEEIEAADHYKNGITDITHSLNAIFSTKDLIGQQYELGVYTCPVGYALNTSSGDTAQYTCDGGTISVCTSRFSNALINPYVEGIYGNWRADTTYSYYGTRKETNPSIAVDIRTGGTITGYKDFWNFNNTASYFLKRNYTANREWAWNSTSTQFNRKGYETENKDPLGRFNAGVYGYNQQLPIAVANNARLREVMFDGFEDYDYKTENNCNQAAADCAIPTRHAIFKDITSANLSSQEHHTGRSSLIVSPGASVLLGAEVKSSTVADAGYAFNMNVLSQQCPDTIVTPKGEGYTLTWDGLPNATNQNIYVKGVVGKKKTRGWLQWEGYILPTSTGYYDFRTTDTDDDITLTIQNNANPSPLGNSMTLTQHFGNGPAIRPNFLMIKGQPYRIVFRLENGGGGDYQASLKWRTPDMKCAGLDYAFIPTNQVYDNNSLGLLQSHVTLEARTVYSLDQSQASGNKFNDKFSPLQETKMVLSAWVKESKDCKCSTYVNNAIDLNIDGTITILKPTGNIIEGWQRYEAYFDIGANAQAMSIALINTGTTGDVFFDDVRIHPFNANEKTFVYHSSNLRLMAELDENNYASFYEYDDDGTLTRVKKETQRGVKTITETRSALYKQTQ